jgi:hypothetical protein
MQACARAQGACAIRDARSQAGTASQQHKWNSSPQHMVLTRVQLLPLVLHNNLTQQQLATMADPVNNLGKACEFV